MSPDTLMLLIYRLAALGCGFGTIVLGYRLFRLGVFERAGELKANWGENSLLLKAAAPGTFLALFGSAVIAVTVWKGFTVETSRATSELGSSSLTASNAGNEAPIPAFQGALQALADGRPLTAEQRSLITSKLGQVETHSVHAK